MKASTDRIKERISKRSLPDLLVRKFLTEYGYTHGPVIAAAIVKDILPPSNSAVRSEYRPRR